MGIHLFLMRNLSWLDFCLTGGYLQLELVFHGTKHTVHRGSDPGRKLARCFYALIGILMIGNGIFFFLSIQGTV